MCNCVYCQLSKRIKSEKPYWNEETKAIVRELWNRLEWAETEHIMDEYKQKENNELHCS